MTISKGSQHVTRWLRRFAWTVTLSGITATFIVGIRHGHPGPKLDDSAIDELMKYLFWAVIPGVGFGIDRLRKQAEKVDEVHRATTINHHSSTTPTILDHLDDIKTSVAEIKGDLRDLRNDTASELRDVRQDVRDLRNTRTNTDRGSAS